MTLLCGWRSNDLQAAGESVVRAMGRALRVRAPQVWGQWSFPGLSVGLLELPEDGTVEDRYTPAASPDGRYYLWMVGEAFAGDSLIEVRDPTSTRTLAFRQTLLAALLRRGLDAISVLDGEYQIVLWDSWDRTLSLINDRFGGLPLYWAQSSLGFGFAGGVRGVLMAPGVGPNPDPEAIREAVTFGGFRLGDRTNIASVKMVPGASVVTVRNSSSSLRRYWRWSDIPRSPAQSLPDLIERAHSLWRQAVGRRLKSSTKAGQTLSGGLDSRAILAEAAPQVPSWTAITYGVPGCDDARYAQRAAEAMGVTWVFHPLYSGRDPDWLEHRSSYIQQTDGLIELVDLMHLESLPLQSRLLDVNLSGYIGDAVSGPTFNDVTSPEDALIRMPYSGTSIGLDWVTALGRMGEIFAGAAARFALFEHKLPQSTNRWAAAWRPWFRVRKPFTDYAFFDFCQGLPAVVRGNLRLHEQWLHARYPRCYATIPNHKTGVPVLASAPRVQFARARRLAWRNVQPWLSRVGLPARPRIRSYHADEVFWRVPEMRSRIEGMILGSDSLCCGILGRTAVSSVVKGWFDRLDGPTQVIGALYVYETYHRELPHHLRAARLK